MRLFRMLLVLAFFCGTLGLPAVRFCAAAPSAATPTVAACCCCGGSCQCGDDCACYRVPPEPPSNPAVVGPTAGLSLFLLAATTTTATAVSPNARHAGDLPASDDWPGPLPSHARCLGTRAPPLS